MELVCIVCPNGCRLTVEKTPAGLVVKGNRCVRGERYGMDEATDPRRTVTAVVRTGSPDHPCVPVKSDRPVPRSEVTGVLRHIYSMRVDLPVKRGDVCIAECGGAAIVYTRTVPPPGEERPE